MKCKQMREHLTFKNDEDNQAMDNGEYQKLFGLNQRSLLY